MNFVGKILVFLIFLFSVVFMTGTFMVFATQKNWRDVVMDPQQGLRKEVNDKSAEIQELNRRITELEERHALQMAERSQWLAASQSRADSTLADYNQLRSDLESAEQQQREAVAQVDMLSQQLATNSQELTQVRTILNDAQKQRNDFQAQVEEYQDDLAEANRKVDQLTKRNEQIAVDLNRHRQALADNNIQLDGQIQVEGVITAIDESFVQLSIGSDDGLQIGKVLDVYRYSDGLGEPKWLGKVEVKSTESDKAVAQIIPEFRQGARVAIGDRVATLATP